MQSKVNEPIQLLTSQSRFFLRPLGYTITLGMLITRWWNADSNPGQGFCIVFEGCERMKVSWQGELGPYKLSSRRTQNGSLEFRDPGGEFEVVCRDVRYLAKDEVAIFFRNLSGAQV